MAINGRKWATIARARCGKGLPCRRWRHGRDTGASSRRIRRHIRLDTPSGKGNMPRPADTDRLKSSAPAYTSSEWAQLRAAAELRPCPSLPPCELSATTSIRQLQPKGKHDLTIFAFIAACALRRQSANQVPKRVLYAPRLRRRRAAPRPAARNALDPPTLARLTGQPRPASRPASGSDSPASESALSAP